MQLKRLVLTFWQSLMTGQRTYCLESAQYFFKSTTISKSGRSDTKYLQIGYQISSFYKKYFMSANVENTPIDNYVIIEALTSIIFQMT